MQTAVLIQSGGQCIFQSAIGKSDCRNRKERGEMKEKYQAVEMEVIPFEAEEVIVTSGGDCQFEGEIL